MTFRGFILRLHLWGGVLLGIQILLWLLSGVVMTWFHISLVRGETNSFIAPPRELVATTYATPGGIIAQADGATTLELTTFQGNPVYIAKGANGTKMFDASTAELLSPIGEDVARTVAESDFSLEAKIDSLRLLDDVPQEYRGETPVWRADFADRLNTRLYISASTGEVVSRRNDVWRLYDFFWMLHIMDYEERSNFNNSLVRAASFAGTIFTVTGLFLVLMRNGRRQITADITTLLRLLGMKRNRR